MLDGPYFEPPPRARARHDLCVSVIAGRTRRSTYRLGYVLTVPPSHTRQAIAPQPETMLSQCWPCRAGQCLDVVAVNGLQVGDQDTVPMPEQFKTKLANVHANPGGFKCLLCVLHTAKAGPKARPLS